MERARVTLPVLEAREDDADDVRWALQVAQARWTDGGQEDAVVWLRRAADSAQEAGNHERAAELREDAEELAEQVAVHHSMPPAPNTTPPNGNGARSAGKPALQPPPPDFSAEPDFDVEVELGDGAVPAPEIEELDSDIVHSLDPDEVESVAHLEPEELDSSAVASLDADDLIGEEEFADDLIAEEEVIGEELGEEHMLEAEATPLVNPLADRLSNPASMMRTLERPSTELGPPPPPGTPGSPEPAPGFSPATEANLDARADAEPSARSATFSEPEQPRQSLGQLEDRGRRGPMASAPELEVEELSGEELDALLGRQSIVGDEPAEETASDAEFDDRLSSVGLEPPVEETAIAQYDSDPSSLSFGDVEAEEAQPELADAADFDLEAADSSPPRAAVLPGDVPDAAAGNAQASAGAAPDEEVPKADEPVEPVVDDVPLDEARGFEDLPPDVQVQLAKSARIETLNRGEEVGFFGAALITRGAVDILPAFADDAGAQARHGDVVFTKGTLDESIELRVEAKIDDTRVAVWEPQEIERVLEASPWVADELRFIADYYLAVCGATLGPLGERLDNSLRTTVLGKMQVRVIDPGQKLAEAGKPVDGLYVIGGGRVEVVQGDQVTDQLSPGDFLFPSTMLSAGPAPHDARAGSGGALVMSCPRDVARELMMSVPPLLELLAY